MATTDVFTNFGVRAGDTVNFYTELNRFEFSFPFPIQVAMLKSSVYPTIYP